jgi:transposase
LPRSPRTSQGTSGRQMLKALIAGSTDACAMARLAKGKLRAKIPQLERALRGCSGARQRFLVAQQLAHIDFLEETIERLSAEIAARVRPFEEAIG